jgi:rSAM/selenodomain-associated transferase 2
VVIPCLGEAGRLPSLLADLADAPGLLREVWVVDGGSRDGTPVLARLAGARILASEAGRGRQLRRGLAACATPWLLLLHADARLPAGWAAAVTAALAAGEDTAWCFRLAIEGAGPALRLVELGANLRSRWRSLPYGDQGLLISRSLLARVGGVAPLPLMEDLELVLRLRSRAPIRCLEAALRVDARRWRRLGVWRTAVANARLRRAWRAGESPRRLAERYYGCG